MVTRPALFTWLEPPDHRGEITVATVAATPAGDVDAYVAAVRAWAHAVWAAWSPHHETVHAWLAPSLGTG